MKFAPYPDDVWQKRILGLIEELDNLIEYSKATEFFKTVKDDIAKIRSFLMYRNFNNFVVADLGRLNLTELQEEHFRLFGPDPVCHLDIAHWAQGDVFMQSRKMAEMAGFYRAFGLDMNEGLKVDNLSVAFEFLSYLCLKILHAENMGADNHIETTEKAMNSFRDEFVLPGLDKFVQSVRDNSKTGFYEVIGGLAKKEIR
ncbi:MAG: molecular chaperone TorD family protein [Candidatus Omnitrophica bacterium]|nr:molecular chaperone TorD family protein [Candidatus Omnitrophota bacterium]